MNRRGVLSKRNTARIAFLLVMVFAVLLAGCGDGLGGDKADVDRVDVQSMAGNPPTYFVIAHGYLPDACTSLGRTQQRVAMRTIKVTLYTRRSDDAFCAPVLVPFRERIRLNVSGLSAGQYSVEVNGAATTLNLTESH